MTGYFEYLCSEVGIGGPNGLPYSRMAEWMMWVDFEAKIAGDRNREADGAMLRQGYSDAPKGRCRVFELLVALCQRMVFMADGLVPYSENTPQWWFEAMVRNLGISMCDDEMWNEDNDDARDICERQIDRWMRRDIGYDGTGGLFPLSHPQNDQANVEIWYQMNAYLLEEMGEN